MIFQRFSVLVCFLVPPVFYGQHAFAANPVVARVGEKLRSSSTRLRIEKYPTSLTNSSAREFPWLVTVHANSGDSCVGALLSSQWALIPAHCGFRISQQLTSTNVVAGSSSHRLYPKNSTVQIERVINHPEFETVDPGSANNDLSLIKLVRPLAVDNQTIKAACLFKTEEERTKPFDDLVVSAFRFKNVPDHWRLMKSNFSDRSFDSNCYQLDNLQLIKAKGLNHSYCLDDLGGLLNYRDEKNQSYVVGINTLNSDCNQPEGINYFTRISNYVGWIKKTIDQDLCLKNVIFM